MWYLWFLTAEASPSGTTREGAIQRFRDKYGVEPTECKRVRIYWHVGPVPQED